MNSRSIISLLLIFSLCQGAPEMLKRDGKNIVNSQGEPVLLRGIGLGGWLVPEGYMLHFPGYGSPTNIRNRILELLGEDDTEEFYRKYRQHYVNRQDIKLIKEWGFNSIRLPFHYAVLAQSVLPATFIEEGFAIVDSLLRWCQEESLYLIFDMHCAPGGQNSDNISDSDGEAKLWTRSENQDLTVEIWREIARRYADKEWIGGYDLLNEPVMPSGYTTMDLRGLYMRITQAIREVDTEHLIFVEGNWYATDMENLTPPWDLNMIYSFHKYWNETTQVTIQQYLNLRNTWGYPLWMGESGENSNPWFHRTITLLEENDIGWCWWTHKKVATITSPLSSPISQNYQVILDYWGGSTPKPTNEMAKIALFGMAEDLAIRRCDLHPDVLAAIFSDEFGSTTVPYTSNQIPGVIHCVNYDIGDAGIAYGDQDYIKTRWDIDMPWNHGREYRNDGVDIEQDGGEYNIGWIESGEWLKYTVDVAFGGTYTIVAEIACPDGSGEFSLILNDEITTGIIDVPNTGGWHNWGEVIIEDMNLPKGKGQLRLNMIAGGFNIRSLTFIPQLDDSYKNVNDSIFLGQSYPNPFTTEVTIPLLVLEAGDATISIYNTRGELVRRLMDGQLFPGAPHFVWNGFNELGESVGSGVYFVNATSGAQMAVKKMLLLR